MSASVFPVLAPRVAGTGCCQPPGKLVSKYIQSERAAVLTRGCLPAALSARLLSKVISGADENICVRLLLQRIQSNITFYQDRESFEPFFLIARARLT
jgi:hypothetical protein